MASFSLWRSRFAYLAHMRRNEGPIVSEVESYLLPEDVSERRMFDEMSKAFGGPLPVLLATLRAMACSFSRDGSMAKQCVIMSNEIAKLIDKHPSDASTAGSRG